MFESFLTSLLTNILTTKFFWYFIAALAVSTGVFWLLWVLGNVFYLRRKRLAYMPLLAVAGVVGLVVDVLYQITFAVLIFLELPKESTLSMRLKRYLRIYGVKSGYQFSTNPLKRVIESWRLSTAIFLATHLIEPWAQGHIGLVRFGYTPARDAMTPLMARLKNIGI